MLDKKCVSYRGKTCTSTFPTMRSTADHPTDVPASSPVDYPSAISTNAYKRIPSALHRTNTSGSSASHWPIEHTTEHSMYSYISGNFYSQDTDLLTTVHTLSTVTCGTCHGTTARKRLHSISRAHSLSKGQRNAPPEKPTIIPSASWPQSHIKWRIISTDEDLFRENLSEKCQCHSTGSDFRLYMPAYRKVTCGSWGGSFAPTLIPAIPTTEWPKNTTTSTPTWIPTIKPTNTPTTLPTNFPRNTATNVPYEHPANKPTNRPSQIPIFPTKMPSVPLTNCQTSAPSTSSTNIPTDLPTQSPTNIPTSTPRTLLSVPLTEYPITFSTDFHFWPPKPP